MITRSGSLLPFGLLAIALFGIYCRQVIPEDTPQRQSQAVTSNCAKTPVNDQGTEKPSPPCQQN